MPDRPTRAVGARPWNKLESVVFVALVSVGIAAIVWVRVGPGAGAVATPTQDVASTPSASEWTSSSPRDYEIHIEEGLAVTWNAEAAATRVLTFIAANEKKVGRVVATAKILSVDAMAGKDAPAEISEGSLDEYGAVWIVHALGTFTNSYGPVTVEPGGEGWYIFDDSGQVVGTGFRSQ